MTVELLSTVSGIVISLIASFVPAFERLPKASKQITVLLVLAAVTVAIAGLSCFGALDYVECNAAGFVQALQVFLTAAGAAVATHLGTKEITAAAKNRFIR